MLEAGNISVVLPVYNGEKFILEAVDSILQQKDVEFELIISDDCSTDATLAQLQRIENPAIRIIRNNKNLGIFGNLNRCLDAASCDYIQIFSQDDVMLPGFLASQRSKLESVSGAGLVYGAPIYIDESGIEIGGQPVDTTPSIVSKELYLWIAAHYGALPASISSVMVHRKTLQRVGGFNTRFRVAGDVDFYNRVSEDFLILYDQRKLHKVRGHRLATSALKSSGADYLQEELVIQEWYRKRMTADDFRKVQRFRSVTRGVTHLKWIARALLAGQWATCCQAMANYRQIYPLEFLPGWALRRMLFDTTPPKPELRPPNEAKAIH